MTLAVVFIHFLILSQDGSDESNCPQTCPEYECNDGTCRPFSDRCNGIFDCDSDELCCGQDQFECRRRPQTFFAQSLEQTSWNNRRCIPRDFVCNGRPDCLDGWDEASCENMATLPTTAAAANDSAGETTGNNKKGSMSSMGSEFPSVYTVVIVSAIIVVLIVFSLIGYMCSKRCVSPNSLSKYF